MRCSKCGSENREGRKFCAQCGGPLTAKCSKCGSSNEPDEKFCGQCGAALLRATACAHRAVERLTNELYQATQSRVGRDAAIPICIIREWVQLYEREKSAGNRSHAIKVPRAACRWLCLATSAPRRHACPSRSGSEFRRWRPSLVSL